MTVFHWQKVSEDSEEIGMAIEQAKGYTRHDLARLTGEGFLWAALFFVVFTSIWAYGVTSDLSLQLFIANRGS